MPTLTIPDLFRDIQIKFSRMYAALFLELDISLPQYALLSLLSSTGAIPMSEAGRKLHITKPAVTHLVDQLEKKGFLERKDDPRDRRIFLLLPRPRGLKIVRRVQAHVFGFFREALKRFSRSEQEVIMKFYGDLALRLEAAISPGIRS